MPIWRSRELASQIRPATPTPSISTSSPSTKCRDQAQNHSAVRSCTRPNYAEILLAGHSHRSEASSAQKLQLLPCQPLQPTRKTHACHVCLSRWHSCFLQGGRMRRINLSADTAYPREKCQSLRPLQRGLQPSLRNHNLGSQVQELIGQMCSLS